MSTKLFRSVAAKLSILFMFVLTTAVLLVSVVVILFTGGLVKRSRSEELIKAEKRISEILNIAADFTETEELKNYSSNIGVPYYITYIAYENESGNLVATNDPFLPLLPSSGGKTVHFYDEDFFFDGSLDVLYYADVHQIGGKEITVATVMNMDNNSIGMIYKKVPVSLLIFIAPILILSFFVSYLLVKKTIKPVVKITKTAQSMTTENLDGQLPLTGNGDELDELSRTFNELFMRIKADFDRERQFSSDVSHELNTPLTVITGQTNLLLRWGKDNPQQLEKSLNAIKNESKSMHVIIDNLLQISRIESGRVKAQIASVKLDEMFSRIAEEVTSLAPAKIEIFGNGLELNSDAEMLHQILMVFVSNSIKYAGENCQIKLIAEKTENSLVIRSIDDGPGISQKALPHVFDRFFRADEAHNRKSGGSGLGLAIAKTLSDAIGAEISAKNHQPTGAEFILVFPLPV